MEVKYTEFVELWLVGGRFRLVGRIGLWLVVGIGLWLLIAGIGLWLVAGIGLWLVAGIGLWFIGSSCGIWLVGCSLCLVDSVGFRLV